MRRMLCLVVVIVGSLLLPELAVAQPGTSVQGSPRLRKLVWLQAYHLSRLAHIIDQIDAEGLSVLGDSMAQSMAKLQGQADNVNAPDTIRPGSGADLVQAYFEVQKHAAREVCAH